MRSQIRLGRRPDATSRSRHATRGRHNEFRRGSIGATLGAAVIALSSFQVSPFSQLTQLEAPRAQEPATLRAGWTWIFDVFCGWFLVWLGPEEEIPKESPPPPPNGGDPW